MRKRKPPKLVVDNKLPAEPTKGFTYPEFKVIAEQLLDMHCRYPEIDTMAARARDSNDQAMSMVLFELLFRYDFWRDVLAEEERKKLRVVKRKRD
jgi:hypothetical protein